MAKAEKIAIWLMAIILIIVAGVTWWSKIQVNARAADAESAKEESVGK